MDLSHHWRDTLRVIAIAKDGARADLPLELALGPASFDGREDIELARLDGLRLAEEDEVMGPRQLCHQR